MSLKEKIKLHSHIHDCNLMLMESISDDLTKIVQKYIPNVRCHTDLHSISFESNSCPFTDERKIQLEEVFWILYSLVPNNRIYVDTVDKIYLTEEEADKIESDLMEVLK